MSEASKAAREERDSFPINGNVAKSAVEVAFLHGAEWLLKQAKQQHERQEASGFHAGIIYLSDLESYFGQEKK